MSQQIRVTLHHDGSIGSQVSIPPSSLAIVNGITTTTTSSNKHMDQMTKKQEIEDFLTDIWCIFGTVIKVMYHKSYTYGIITYSSHTNAVFAFAGINDPIQFQVAMQTAIGANVQRAQYARLLFRPNPTSNYDDNRTCTPTWVD